jgi:hypothetical protein
MRNIKIIGSLLGLALTALGICGAGASGLGGYEALFGSPRRQAPGNAESDSTIYEDNLIKVTKGQLFDIFFLNAVIEVDQIFGGNRNFISGIIEERLFARLVGVEGFDNRKNIVSNLRDSLEESGVSPGCAAAFDEVVEQYFKKFK